MKEERERVELASLVAEAAHRGQMREGAALVPFFTHPCEVVRILRRCGAGAVLGESVYVVGYLHDVVEDTPFPLKGIEALFGSQISSAVALLTMESGVGGLEKTEEQVRVMLSPETPACVRAVKIADKTANLIDLVRYSPGWEPAREDRFVGRADRVVEAALSVGALPSTDFCLRKLAAEYRAARSHWASHRRAVEERAAI